MSIIFIKNMLIVIYRITLNIVIVKVKFFNELVIIIN